MSKFLKYGFNLLILGGAAIFTINTSTYIVNPGYKALIMDSTRGLQKKVYS